LLLIRCPYSGEFHPEIEFAYAGEAHIIRPDRPLELSDEEWRNFLFIRTNPRGLHFERWRHIHGTGRFFNAVRDTVTDKFITTYKIGVRRPTLEEIEKLQALDEIVPIWTGEMKEVKHG